MSKEKLDVLEVEIANADRALLNLETELMEEYPSYAELKKRAAEVIKHGKRVRKAIKRDRKYFA